MTTGQQIRGEREYRHVLNKATGEALTFRLSEGIFVPTHTSQLLIDVTLTALTGRGMLLDLGCGIGVCGLVLGKLGACGLPVHLSDVSAVATDLARENAERLDVPAVVRCGDLFAPWAGEQFDVIVDDVSGVCEEIACASSWFPEGVGCASGRDGAELVVRMLEQAPAHLKSGGTLIFPVLSLSNEVRILETAHRVFADLTLLAERTWFLPEELAQRTDILDPLQAAGFIQLEYKFGAWLWRTRLYRATTADSRTHE
ncbi:MAG TPA: hypothetical protein DD714_00320 [Candidatus Omnitrophica bacterium]|nr:hypothetical protein [Candidatus Omnitrophota bacterium]